MKLSPNYKHIITFSKYKHSALILFGSYSRGDYDPESDIDVLEITSNPHRPYSINKVNYSTYTLDQLKVMANNGNLFVLHIILEGKLIDGQSEVLEYLKKEFKKPDNYNTFRQEILLTAKLLDVSEQQYSENPKGYFGLLCYLFRSYLYSVMYDAGEIHYSIKTVSGFYGDFRINEIFKLKYQKQVSFLDFEKCKKIFEEYAKKKFLNELKDPGLLLKSIKSSSSFAISMGIHFLRDTIEDIPY